MKYILTFGLGALVGVGALFYLQLRDAYETAINNPGCWTVIEGGLD